MERRELMKAKKPIKAKDLKQGMHVVIVRGPDKKKMKRTARAHPVTIAVFEYPYAVLEYERDAPSMSIGPIKLPGSGATRSTFTLDVRGGRFREVSAEYVDAIRNLKSEPSVWEEEKN